MVGEPPEAFPNEREAKERLAQMGIDVEARFRRWTFELVGPAVDDVIARGLARPLPPPRPNAEEAYRAEAADQRAHLISELHRLYGMGWSVPRIARWLGVPSPTLYRWLNEPRP
jgi:hypothetical protein